MLPSVCSRTPPLSSFLLRRSFLLRDTPIFFQRPDCALTDYWLPPKLTVVDDFDDDGRHVKFLTREMLWRDREQEREIQKKKRKHDGWKWKEHVMHWAPLCLTLSASATCLPDAYWLWLLIVWNWLVMPWWQSNQGIVALELTPPKSRRK